MNIELQWSSSTMPVGIFGGMLDREAMGGGHLSSYANQSITQITTTSETQRLLGYSCIENASVSFLRETNQLKVDSVRHPIKRIFLSVIDFIWLLTDILLDYNMYNSKEVILSLKVVMIFVTDLFAEISR